MSDPSKSKNKISVFFSLLASLTLASQVSGCWPKKTDVEIHIQAHSDQGDPIAQADILLNRNLVARTDNHGRAIIIEKLEVDQRASIEIRKESSTRYYAPFFHSFVIEGDDASRLQLQGILYSVPKPSPEPLPAPELAETDEKPWTDEDESEDIADVDGHIKIEPEVEIEDKAKLTDHDTKERPIPDEAAVIRPQDISQIQPDETSASPPSPLNDTNKALINFYSHVNNQALAEVDIYIGYEGQGQLQLACKTNRQGRCSFRISEPDNRGEATIIARKTGHRTARQTQILQDGDRIRLGMPRGETIDVFAINKRYGFARGLKGVEVRINGESVGMTDSFGHFAHFYRGRAQDLVEVSLVPQDDYLPRIFSTDYIVSGPMSLVKYFAPKKPQPIRIGVMPVQAAGRLQGRTLSTFSGELNPMIQRAMSQHFFNSQLFEEFEFEELHQAMSTANISIGKISREGWQQSELKASLDAIMIPTVIMQNPLQLELSLIDSTGTVLVADKHQLVSYQDRNAIAQAIRDLAIKIQSNFPFEGTIIAKDDESLMINLGSGAGYQVKTGDKFAVYGLQTDLHGQNKSHARIGLARVSQVMNDRSQVRIVETAPRSLIGVGDQVVFQRQEASSSNKLALNVIDNSNSSKIAQANVYFNQKWVGATNQDGLVEISRESASGRGVLGVIKHGYRDFTREVNLSASQRIEVKLIREAAYLRVDTVPQGVEVFVDDQRIGSTPLERPVAVPSGFVKIELRGPEDYKVFNQVLQLEEGTLDLTGERAIYLEKDLRRTADKLIDRGDILGAIEILERIPEDHSDHLLGLHQAGELYLGVLGQAAKAAEIFGRITSEPSVRNFNDKRFIGSHVNEGVALFMAGQNLEARSAQLAVAHFQKAIEVMNRTEPQLRHINQLEFPQAVHNVSYYRALSHHKIWDMTDDPIYLSEAHRAWQRYLDNDASAVPLKSGASQVENAKIYFRQTKAALESAERRTARGN